MLVVIPILLSIVDFAAGVAMLGHNYFAGSDFVVFVAGIVLVKGVWSLATSVMMKYFADWMGIVDIAAGIVLFLMISGMSIAFYQIVGIVMIIKAIYSWIRFFFGF